MRLAHTTVLAASLAIVAAPAAANAQTPQPARSLTASTGVASVDGKPSKCRRTTRWAVCKR